MPFLNLKPNHQALQTFYREIKEKQQLSFLHEGAVAPHFSKLLQYCGRQFNWTLIEQYPIARKGQHPLKADGVLLDEFKLIHGIWEAKDTHDDLPTEVKKKFQAGYPQDNILFQAPERAMLYQDGSLVIDADLSKPPDLIDTLKLFFEYQPPEYEQWGLAVDEFKDKVPELARSLLQLIEEERKYNKRFVQALDDFTELVRQAINPNIAMPAIEEMLIQHLLTERIFRKVFNNPDFANRNIIAVEIEKVIQALTSRHFSRNDFLGKLDRFYGAIETTAATIDDFAQKQDFLNTVYEKFFQGFSIKVADTHGIVYTPQPIVEFMVRSVDDILQKEFHKSLGHRDVHILDPFVGTGNFILRIMRQIPKTLLSHKYAHELHCNEVMLLPYYIAALNIEHAYFELIGQYQPFEGICLVDTFELAEGRQMSMFAKANTERVEQQKQTPIFVVIGNPPYNDGQVNENDNNKNRKYPTIDKRVSETFARGSRASSVIDLNDPYIKAFRWATDRILRNGEGVVALVTNNKFIDGFSFDGVRKNLSQDFERIYIVNLKGDIRTDSMREGIPLGEKHTVFGLAAMVGVSITFLIKKPAYGNDQKIFYSEVDWKASREEKFNFLEKGQTVYGLSHRQIYPDKNHTWLTEGFKNEFESFLPIASKETKTSKRQNVEAIFKVFSNGNDSGRDNWVYNFDPNTLLNNNQIFVTTYNAEIDRWLRSGQPKDVDNFVLKDDKRIKWTRNAKRDLQRQRYVEFSSKDIRQALYRPFTIQYWYSGRIFNKEVAQFPFILPDANKETENREICICGYGRKAFSVLLTNRVPDLNLYGDPHKAFPFYTYDEDGSNRRENITDWALEQFQMRYAGQPRPDRSLRPVRSEDDAITKWDIFHYVYALLHHPTYRETYAANLRRELPRIPFAEDFWGFAIAGARLAELHVNYEQQPEYPLKFIETPAEPLNWRVEKMRLSKDKSQIKYNEFLTLAGIPSEVFEYKLGNRSALDWVIDQYQVSTDTRSGIVNDPNNLEDEQYIIRLIGQVITVSLETVEIVKSLPELKVE